MASVAVYSVPAHSFSPALFVCSVTTPSYPSRTCIVSVNRLLSVFSTRVSSASTWSPSSSTRRRSSVPLSVVTVIMTSAGAVTFSFPFTEKASIRAGSFFCGFSRFSTGAVTLFAMPSAFVRIALSFGRLITSTIATPMSSSTAVRIHIAGLFFAGFSLSGAVRVA